MKQILTFTDIKLELSSSNQISMNALMKKLPPVFLPELYYPGQRVIQSPIKEAQNSFQHLDLMAYYNHSVLLVTTIMVYKPSQSLLNTLLSFW